MGYHLLYWLSRLVDGRDHCSGAPYRGRSKLEVLFGEQIWNEVQGKTAIDFGCGPGLEAVEMAQHGARKVIGIDIREKMLSYGARAAERAGVSDRCVFTARTSEQADVIFSVDAFEHYDDPREVLRAMRQLVKNDGRVIISFGPPWFHPLGGHLFSVFPWAHLIFTEKALIRWRSDFKSDGATRFCEVDGGLNQMTLRRFKRLLAQSDFEIESLELVPIRRLRPLHNRLTQEFLTAGVRCRLTPGKASGRAF